MADNPPLKLRRPSGSETWLKIVDGAVAGQATAAEIEAWERYLTSDAQLPISSPPAADAPDQVTGAWPEDAYLCVAPWREPRYDPARFDEEEFLKRAVARFRVRAGCCPDTVYVRPSHPSLQNGLADRAARVGLKAISQAFVPAGAYYLARTNPQATVVEREL